MNQIRDLGCSKYTLSFQNIVSRVLKIIIADDQFENQMASKKKNASNQDLQQSQQKELLLPDSQFILRNVSEICYLDNDNLYSRIQTNEFNYCHAIITKYMARKFQVPLLSELVIEKLDTSKNFEKVLSR